MKKHSISIITPAFNTKPEFLHECIKSVLEQDFQDFEWLIFDDNSDSYVAEIINSYNDKRIKYFRNTEDRNIGPSAARNFLLNASSGKYIAILDSDDLMIKTRLSKQYNYLEKHKDVGCVGAWALKNGEEIIGNQIDNDSLQIETKLLLDTNVYVHSSIMFRKSVIDAHNLRYDNKYVPAEDYEFYIRLIDKTKFGLIPEVLCLYRWYEENISNQQRAKQIEKGNLAQFDGLERKYGISIEDKLFLCKYFSEVKIEPEQLISALSNLYDKLKEYPDVVNLINSRFRNRYKEICYKTHKFKIQWKLLFSPMRSFFKLKKSWQIFCFLSRGLF